MTETLEKREKGMGGGEGEVRSGQLSQPKSPTALQGLIISPVSKVIGVRTSDSIDDLPGNIPPVPAHDVSEDCNLSSPSGRMSALELDRC